MFLFYFDFLWMIDERFYEIFEKEFCVHKIRVMDKENPRNIEGINYLFLAIIFASVSEY
jgi:hypothetical protein